MQDVWGDRVHRDVPVISVLAASSANTFTVVAARTGSSDAHTTVNALGVTSVTITSRTAASARAAAITRAKVVPARITRIGPIPPARQPVARRLGVHRYDRGRLWTSPCRHAL